jgi:hypothetical protein
MSVHQRSNAQLALSMIVGFAFAMFMAAQAVVSLYYLGDAVIGSPVHGMSIVRAGIVSIWVVLSGFWAFAGMVWTAEDILDVVGGGWRSTHPARQ